MPSILFVCTANICRSPIAVGLFRNIIEEKPDADQWRIESAGTWGLDGESAAEGSRLVMKQRGVDISAHRARTVTRKLIAQFDLILTMEVGHKEALRLEFPESRSKIYQLSETIGHYFDIPDPIGQPIERFQKTASEMDQLLRNGLARIEELVSGQDG